MSPASRPALSTPATTKGCLCEKASFKVFHLFRNTDLVRGISFILAQYLRTGNFRNLASGAESR